MSGQSIQLSEEARRLRALADEVEGALDRASTALRDLETTKAFDGPLADDTRGELADNRSRLRETATDLRDEAAARDRRARDVEDTDSIGEDVVDFLSGRDRTPWS